MAVKSNGICRSGLYINDFRNDAWADDYIWLPSYSEIVKTSSFNGIWNFNYESMLNDNWNQSYEFFFRSASNGTSSAFNTIRYMTTDRVTSNGTIVTAGKLVNIKATIRPAIHLNLMEADANSKCYVKNPTDISSEYTGEGFSIDNVADAEKYWYDEEKIDLTFYNEENEKVNASSAGTYWVKAEIKPEVLATEPETAFGETGDKTDPDHMESNTVRWCKLTVNKRKIGLEFSTDSRGMPIGEFKSLTDSGTGIYEGDTLENGRMPILGFKYAGRGSTTYPSSTTPPSKQGTYTATAYLVNADDVSYELDESSLTTDFEIIKALPTFSATDINVVYGTAYEVDITTDSDSAVTVTYYESNGTTPITGNVKPTDVGVYVAKLTTTETSNFAADTKTITITITIAKPTVNPIVPEKVYFHEGDEMPEIKLSDGDTAGSIKWAAGSTVQLGPHTYTWEYTPNDRKNYETASGQIELNFLQVTVDTLR